MTIYTIRDVARLAGVSVTTVSRVLNHQPDVSEATRERVEQVIASCHFVGNANARGLKQAEPKTVAVIMRGYDNAFLNSLAQSVSRRAVGTGYSFATVYIDESADEFRTAARLCGERRPAGFMFLGSSIDRRCAVMKHVDVPLVFVTADTTGTPMDREGTASVSVDDLQLGRRAAEALIGLGHRRIAFIGGSGKGQDSFARRHHGALEAMKAAGIRPDPACFAPCRFSMRSGKEQAERLLTAHPEVTAIFCMSDVLAMGAVRGLTDMGLRVPGDVSVLGFDGLESSAYLVPSLSTVVQPVEELAEAGVRSIVGLLNGEDTPRHILIPASLELRGSTAAPEARSPHGTAV